jgi:hypothetical protein
VGPGDLAGGVEDAGAHVGPLTPNLPQLGNPPGKPLIALLQLLAAASAGGWDIDPQRDSSLHHTK